MVDSQLLNQLSAVELDSPGEHYACCHDVQSSYPRPLLGAVSRRCKHRIPGHFATRRLNRRARRSRQFQSLELMLRHETAVCVISKPSQSSQQQSPQNNVSATHKALNIGDILFAILDFLDPHLLEKDFAEKEKKTRLRTLARIARTCKSLQDPALALLWREQDGIDAIFSIFNIQHMTQGGNTIQLPSRYIERIRRLQYGGITSDADMSKLTVLFRVNKGKPLFTRLRHLQLKCWPLTPTEASLLFGPCVETIDLVGRSVMVNSPQRTILFGRQTSRQQEYLCIHTLLKQSPKIRTFRSLTLPRLDVLEEKYLDSIFDLAGSTPRLRDDRSAKNQAARPAWLEKVFRIMYLSRLHFDACELDRDMASSATKNRGRCHSIIMVISTSILSPLCNMSPFALFSCRHVGTLGCRTQRTFCDVCIICTLTTNATTLGPQCSIPLGYYCLRLWRRNCAKFGTESCQG